MPIIIFEGSMAVNIKTIDEQHKKLVDSINKLSAAMKSGRGKDVLDDILIDLLAYAEYHFEKEEELFEKYNYPDSDKHIEEHRSFKEKVVKFNNEYQEKKNLGITLEVLNFLADWLRNHIKKTDKAYAKFFNDLGVY
ncbi:MAG: bacteriohemerythrin [Deferribacterota bacterium]|nr:bacteriohemerythrin [Deferribacterota bacterium]